MASVRRPGGAARAGRQTAGTAASRSTGRSSSRWAARTAADGGHGGSVELVVDPSVHTLLDFHFRPARQGGERQGRRGLQPGRRQWRRPGAAGARTAPSCRRLDGEVLADLVGVGHQVRGRPGRARRARQRRHWPTPAARRRASPSSASRASVVDVVLELKSVADVGLVGFPVGGQVLADLGDLRGPAEDRRLSRSPRSCPISAWSRPGTTTFVVADVPGLIPGAATGKGLGLEFLRHIERCAVLVHVVDCATLETSRDPLSRHRRDRG